MWGWINDEIEIVDEIRIFDPEQFTWELMPTARRQFSTVGGLEGGFFVLFGRAKHALLNDVWYFDDKLKLWETYNNWTSTNQSPVARRAATRTTT